MAEFKSPVMNKKLLVMYSVIHKRVFTPLWDLQTEIETTDHSSNSTKAFAFAIKSLYIDQGHQCDIRVWMIECLVLGLSIIAF